MKLELKHIIPYLPYGLKCEILNYKSDYTGLQYSELNGYYMVGDVPHFKYVKGMTGKSFEEFKPILRPMSDLTKKHHSEGINSTYIELLDSDFAHLLNSIDESLLTWILEEIEGNENPEDLLYGLIQQLIEWHFDVFNLIPQGLAISIHEV